MCKFAHSFIIVLSQAQFYRCDICGKGFPQNYKLRNHKLIHEKKGFKLEVVDVAKTESQDPEVVYQHEVHVEAAAQHLLEI